MSERSELNHDILVVTIVISLKSQLNKSEILRPRLKI